ncbi:MAG: 30S ribosomal protein S17 [Armatimonadota bacterium]|nr:30S ribosomal protein S17 [Armatimonadota bacterium]
MAERGKRKVQVGVVTSDKMTKTVVVRIETTRRHPLYKKTMQRFHTLKAHDEAQAARVGDRVKIMETRPLSKDKCWRVVEILERAR